MHIRKLSNLQRRAYLAATLNTALLAACGGGGSSDQAPPAPSPPSAPPAPPASPTPPVPPSAFDWQGAQVIDGVEPGFATTPDVAMNATGHAVAVWAQFANARSYVLGSFYAPTTGWGAPFLIDDTASASIAGGTPQVAMDDNGNIIAVWRRDDSPAAARQDLWAKQFKWGDASGAPQQLDTELFSVFDPRLAMNASGRAVVVWRQSSAGLYGVWARQFTLAEGWGAARRLASRSFESGADIVNPQLVIDAAGNATAVFASGGQVGSVSSSGTVWASHVDWIGNGVDANRPCVSRNAKDHLAMAWVTTAHIVVLRATPDEFTIDVIAQSPHAVDLPQLAIDAAGNTILVWQQSDDPTQLTNIYASRLVFNPDVGSTWSVPALIGAKGAGNASAPQIAMDAAGNATVVWLQEGGPAGAAQSLGTNRFTPEQGWGTARLLPITSNGDAAAPHLAASAGGQAVAVWSQRPSRGVGDIWANVYK
jgi:hypothetical protein